MTSHNEHIYKVSHLCELLNVFAESLLEKTTLNIANISMVSRQCELLDVLASCLFEQILFHNGHIKKVYPQYVFFHVLSGDHWSGLENDLERCE